MPRWTISSPSTRLYHGNAAEGAERQDPFNSDPASALSVLRRHAALLASVHRTHPTTPYRFRAVRSFVPASSLLGEGYIRSRGGHTESLISISASGGPRSLLSTHHYLRS